MIEGSGSLPLTNGSGSGSMRPKNLWIRWIRIRIRIRNTEPAGVARDQRQPAARGVADRGPTGRLPAHGGHERLPAGGCRPDGRYYLQGDDAIGKL
jgi:hypothetical protein